MERKQTGDEFDAVIEPNGKISVPHDIAQRFGAKRVHVRLQAEEVTTELKSRGVTEDEIEQIAAMQLEPREQVVKFLLSEGALRSNASFLRRVRGLKR